MLLQTLFSLIVLMHIQKDISLKPYNTFQVEVNAKYFVEITSDKDIQELFQDPLFQTKRLILGGGANILLTKDFEGIVIKVALKGIQQIARENGKVILKVGAGENRQDFVQYCCENQYAGIENLAWIPWNVGTAPVSNIGAYGMEVSKVIVKVEGYDLKTQEFKVFSKDECKFGYRSSIFKKELSSEFLVTAVFFELQEFSETYSFQLEYPDFKKYFQEKELNPDDLTLKDVMNAVIEIRNNKIPDPKLVPSAWSFFENPVIPQSELASLLERFPQLKSFPSWKEGYVKLSAGQLIDLAWLKGYSNGKAWTSEKHALILINQGGTAQDILEVANHIQTTVFQTFWVELHPEVVYVS